MNIFKKTIFNIFVRISLALFNVEHEILKADPNNLNERNKINQKRLHRNPVINKMEQGQRDEQYTQDYYEILKKADKFLRTATPNKIAGVADRFGMNLGIKDKYGKRYDHVGFYDPKNKNYGKTLGEVLEKQTEERRLKDDDYELLQIINNEPIEVGMSKLDEIIETKTDKSTTGFEGMNEYEKSKKRKFPIHIERDDNDVFNKIEQLTEFLHIKKIGFEHRLYEFFIPKKFKLHEHLDNNEMINELSNINQIWFHDDYGKYIGYRVDEFEKIINTNEYDIIKLKGVEIREMTI